MIARKNRFHGHRSVSRVKGSTVHSESFSFRFAKSSRSDYRLAVVVSKKVSSKAVVRNRIRRRIFECIRTQKRLQGIGVDIVIYVKTDSVATMKSEELQAQVLEMTKKVLQKL